MFREPSQLAFIFSASPQKTTAEGTAQTAVTDIHGNFQQICCSPLQRWSNKSLHSQRSLPEARICTSDHRRCRIKVLSLRASSTAAITCTLEHLVPRLGQRNLFSWAQKTASSKPEHTRAGRRSVEEQQQRTLHGHSKYMLLMPETGIC
ncbi:Hypothetical predicted protein [Pelobates cultripes]|uniref:Uncharacterized protein n=1 Tax=Pelobates cultripes TaxID=61616 RepID=A0AAD1QYD1_PELCU|nr:Hypothetical predicted protein [Pelobates cultripes]